MKIRKIHSWDVPPKEAVYIQRKLLHKVRIEPLGKIPRLIASADASFRKGRAIGAVIVMTFPALKIVEKIVKKKALKFPYIPTLLTFREGPVLCECFRSLKSNPDLIIFDGQGIAHPRMMGLATHLGLFLGKPTIGCAKSRLYGGYGRVGMKRGTFSYLKDKNGTEIGAVLRTREGVKPIFVSPGYKINIEDSVKIVMRCSKKYRIPEPIRLSHALSKN